LHAYYQAGHAVIALQQSLEVIGIYIEDRSSSWIDVRYPIVTQSRLSRSARARSDAVSIICAHLGGPAAQLRYSFGSPPDPLPDFDLASPYMIESEAVWHAISLAGKVSQDGPLLIHILWRRVNYRIHRTETWSAIDAVARGLMTNGELAGCEVQDIVRRALNCRLGRSD